MNKRSRDERRHSHRHHKKKSRHHSPKSSPKRSRSHHDNLHKSTDSHDDDDKDEQTNLLTFTFLDYKSELNKVLMGFRRQDQLIDDDNDFWLFVSKYENLLKKSGQCILTNDPPLDTNVTCQVPYTYSKSFYIGVSLTTKFDELFGRLSSNERSKITVLKLRQFLQILVHYLDFRQKEKFAKLRKLRKAQSELPISQYKTEIIEAVRQEKVVLIAGDTGCGKSTQIPQYLYEAGYNSIACTQPRRIACVSLSKRVSHEMLCEYETKVGYQIRFERNKSSRTKIVFITEGLLLRQLSTESMIMSQYDVIILDEVHERHLHGDFLIGLAKCLLKIRPELKLILMSATINIQLFADYFQEENVKIIEVPGRLYPIKLHYMPPVQDYANQIGKSEKLSPEPYVQIMQLIDNKYPSTEKGDLLIFMSGLNEITTIIDSAKEYVEKKNNWIILPLHSNLSIADQDKVFDYAPDGMRKCIVSTNIAETSVTIDGIRFVIDSGKVKEMSYDPSTKMQRLKEFWISKASANQRKGRAGRTGPGVCYRLYSEKMFQDLESYSTAEIHRVPLQSLLLQMIAMGLPDARQFPFLESPPSDSIETSILSLKKHEAITTDEKLTPLGFALSRLPVDISMGKMLLMGCVFQQLQTVLTLAAALSVQTPFTNRAYRDPECEKARKDLESDHGDPITILNAYKEWLEIKQIQFNRGEQVEGTKKWCRRRGIEEQRFYEIIKLRRQFQDLLADCGIIETISDTSATMSSGERAIRHGELRQLRQMRKEHKMEAPRKRKLLKYDPWMNENDDEDDGKTMDLRDVEFRLAHDSSKINNLVSDATACSYRDVMILKLILVSGLYPQIAIGDDFNYCKSANQQFYHTESKPYVCLHPMGFFANNTQILQLTEPDIVEKTGQYKSKLPLSSKHQLLCYLSLLETSKPYLMNTLRMPAAQTLLLFAHEIDTNATFSRMICDSWLCLDFPVPESGQQLIYRASNLRRSWNKLLTIKLENNKNSIENITTKSDENCRELEMELWQNLATFMNSEIVYTIKRLLPADLKTLYSGQTSADILLDPNPFADDFECVANTKKGGVFITENICYNCVNETDWSMEMANEILLNQWQCTECKNSFCISGIERLQHLKTCKSVKPEKDIEIDEVKQERTSSKHGTKKFYCSHCNKTMYLVSVDILKHKKTCF